MIYDKLATMVDQARNDIQSGTHDVNAALIKASQGENVEVTKRAVEKFNLDSFLELLKSGNNKGDAFPVADPKEVLKNRIDAEVATSECHEKAASLFTDEDNSFYDKSEMIKCAANSTDAQRIPGLPMSSETFLYYTRQRKAIIEKKAELYQESLDNCRDILTGCMEKIAEKICNNQDRANELFKNVDARGHRPELTESLCKLARVKYSRTKVATAFYDDEDELSGYYDTADRAMDKMASLATAVEDYKDTKAAIFEVEKRAGFFDWVGRKRDPIKDQGYALKMNLKVDRSLMRLDSKAIRKNQLPSSYLQEDLEPFKTISNELKSNIAKEDENINVWDPKLKATSDKKEQMMYTKRIDDAQERQRAAKGDLAKAEAKIKEIKSNTDLSKNPALKAQALQKYKAKADALAALNAELKGLGKSSPLGLKRIGQEITSGATQANALSSFMWGGGKNLAKRLFKERDAKQYTKGYDQAEQAGVDVNNELKSKYVFMDLANTDPMLAEQDIGVLGDVFDAVHKLAPNVARNKEIMRAVLRQVTSQSEPVIDPMYATSLIKLDRAMSGDKKMQMSMQY